MAAPGIEAFIAVNRFGLGARPGELGEAANDPRGWLKAQLAGPPSMPAALEGLPDSETVGRELAKRKAGAPAGRQAPVFGLERSADPPAPARHSSRRRSSRTSPRRAASST